MHTAPSYHKKHDLLCLFYIRMHVSFSMCILLCLKPHSESACMHTLASHHKKPDLQYLFCIRMHVSFPCASLWPQSKDHHNRKDGTPMCCPTAVAPLKRWVV
jgi:hypothetical protein